MALEIGGGITLGGGISLTVESGGGGGASSNSIVVANITSGPYDYYGALLTTGNIYTNPGTGDFGTVNSDSIYALYYETDSFNNFNTIIMLNGGTYTGFSVANGVIDSDELTYPRVFTIGGTDYTFNLITNGQYKLSGDPISLTTKVGNTVSLVYDPNNQITLIPNSIIVASYVSGPDTYYGASIFQNYGTLVSDYFKEVRYDGTTTKIILNPGSYTGFSVASDGSIDSDISGSKIFTIDGTTGTFNIGGSPSNLEYIIVGNPFSLNTKAGNTITAIYDPAAQSGGGGGGGGGLTGNNYTGTFGYWGGGVSQNEFMLMILGADTALISDMDTLSNGSSLMIGQLSSSTTITITSITKTPSGSDWTYSGTTTESNTNAPMAYGSIDSLTFAAAAGADISGTAQILDNTYGSIGAAKGSIGGFGELTSTPDSVQFLQYNNTFGKTFIMFIQGTSSGLNISTMDIDGHTSLSLTMNGVTATSENLPTDMGGMYLRFEFTGDLFGIVAATGTILPFSVTLL